MTEVLRHRGPALFLTGVLGYQIAVHHFRLAISAHSGQVAIPWMMNQGRTLFGALLEQHAPGTSVVAAAAQRALPFEPVVVTQLLNLALVLVTSLVVYRLAYCLGGSRHVPAAAAVLVWAWLEPVFGNILFYFDAVLGFGVALAALVWLALVGRAPRWLAALSVGVVLGAATLFKQHAWGAAALFAVWMILFRRRYALRPREFAAYSAGVALLPLAAVGIVAAQGNLAHYIYWNWTFNFSGLMPGEAPTGGFVLKLVLANVFVPACWLLLWRERDRAAWALVALMWTAGAATLVPRPAEIHVMGMLPATSVMSGLVVTRLIDLGRREAVWRRPLPDVAAIGLGLLLAIALGWVWIGVAPLAEPVGTPAYDELKPVAADLDALRQPGDTLFVLPETDSTPQLHVQSEMLPPGTWVKGWSWYLRAPDVVDTLLDEWAARPPDFIVVFPDLLAPAQADAGRLLRFVNAHYRVVERTEAIAHHGDALIYHMDSDRWQDGEAEISSGDELRSVEG